MTDLQPLLTKLAKGRWTRARKMEILILCETYGSTFEEGLKIMFGISHDELMEWQAKNYEHGLDGLRAARRM